MISRTLDRVRRTLLTGAAFVFFFAGGALLSRPKPETDSVSDSDLELAGVA